MILNQELNFAELQRIKNLNFPECLFDNKLLVKAFNSQYTRQHCFYSTCAFGTVDQIKYLLKNAPDLSNNSDIGLFKFLSLLAVLKYEYQSNVRLKKLDALSANQFDLSQTAIDGSTLMHFAANKNLRDCVTYLADMGCDPHKKNNHNETPIGWIISDSEVLAKLFLDSSTDLTAAGLLGKCIYTHHRNHPKILNAIRDYR